MKILTAVALAALLGGCASSPPATTAGTETFAGEVWTWDPNESTVTLWQEGRPVRVKTTPDQMQTLQLHSFARITGTLAPPADVVIKTGTSGPVTVVPKGEAEIIELKGVVTAVDPAGRLTVNSEHGPLHIWVAPGADRRFKTGQSVTLHASVQPVDFVPAAAPTTPTPTPVGGAAAAPSTESSDHAVVNGRITAVNPGGVLVVESPSGPIQVITTQSSRYKVGDAVQVRTTVQSGS